MKTFVCCLLTIVVVVVSAQGPPPSRHGPPPGFEDCKTKHNPTTDDIETFMRHDIPTTNTGACFMACVGKASGMMNADNTINLNKVTEMASHAPADISAKMLQVFQTCKDSGTQNSDECAAAKSIATCLKTQRVKAGLPDGPPPPPPQ